MYFYLILDVYESCKNRVPSHHFPQSWSDRAVI